MRQKRVGQSSRSTGLLSQISKYKKYLLCSILYLAAALIMFYPITLHMNSYVPGTGSDAYQNLWYSWWVKNAVFNLHSNAFYTKLLYWPIGFNLAFSTLSPLSGVISILFQPLGTIFSYNILFFLGFVTSGLSMFILAHYLTKNSYASAIAGFTFTFSAFHIAKSLFIHFIFIGWAPLFLYFLLRLVYEGDKKYWNILGMSTSLALSTLLGNIEQTIMIFLVLVFMVIVFAAYKATRKKVLSIGFATSILLVLLLAFVIGSWNYVPLLRAVFNSGGLGTANYLNNATYNGYWSINPIAFFVPSYLNGIFYKTELSSGLNFVYLPDPIEKVGYIGLIAIILAIYAIGHDRKSMMPWLVGAIIFIVLSMGPLFGLYRLYHAIPGINVIREPGRFDMITELFISILVAYEPQCCLSTYPSPKNPRAYQLQYFQSLFCLCLSKATVCR